MQQLDIQQLNNLRTGNELAAEIPSTSSGHRAFVVIGSYLEGDKRLNGHRVSKVLNRVDEPNLRFWLRRYEVDTKYIENNWDVSEDELHNSTLRTGIPSIEELEDILRTILNDFSLLDVTWKRDNPV
jgi:hypothetical protein